MVVVHVQVKGSSEWVRESFLTPQAYMAYREHMGGKLVSVKPVKRVGRVR